MRADPAVVPTVDDVRLQQRKLLVLDALSQLADQFARDPSLQHLLDATVLTVTGQFAVGNAMLLIQRHHSDSGSIVMSATGKFRGARVDSDWIEEIGIICSESAQPVPRRLGDPAFSGMDNAVLNEWLDMGVRLFVPLAVSESIFGILLLGPRVTQGEFSPEDLDLLHQMLATITPLLSNSRIYADMAVLTARHAQILDSVRQAIFTFDADWQLVMANRAAVEIAYALHSEGASRFHLGISLEAAFPDPCFPGWAERLRNTTRDRAGRLPTTLIAKGKDGELVFSVAVRPRVGTSSANEGVILTLDDKTREADNERRMFELEKFAERGVMASSISHELNNHLGIILGGVELALAAHERGQQHKIAPTLLKLRENIARMERFTAGLMDYGRVNSQKQETQINDLVADVVSFAVAQKRFGSIKLSTSLASGMPSLQVDRDQIAQVLINVLNNAADAIAETGRRDGIIIVATSFAQEAMMLSVSDNGQGMTPEVRDKLFKAHLTTKPKGHGYGLTTCARILEHHQAEVSIDSRVGFGTTFTFRFPFT